MKKYSILIALMLIVSMFAVGCTPATEGPSVPSGNDDGPVFGGKYVYGITGEPTTLNPILSTDAMTNSITNKIFESLVKTNKELELEGELADTWSISDDGTVITFNLKQDVYWHDGEKFTADDVKFTYEVVLHDDYSGVRAKDLKFVEEIVVVNDYEVEIHLSQMDAPLLYKLAGTALAIIPEHIFGDIPVAEMKEDECSWNPIGTGPYKFVEYAPGQHTVLTANTDYHGEGPYIETIMVKTYQDNQVLMAAFENGDVDYIENIPVNDIAHVTKSLSSKAEFIETPNNGYYYLGLKQNHPILGDLKVRQALMYALDRQTIVDTVFKGYGTMINSHSVPFSWAYNDDVVKYQQNKDKAIALLEEAGWNKVNADGIRENDKGEKLSFVMVSASGNEDKANVIAMVDEQWKEIGVDVVVEYYERSVLFTKYLDAANFEAYMWGWNLSIDPDSYLMFHTESGVDENGNLQGFNDVEYSNSRVDELLEQGRATYDVEERKAIYGELQQILNEELPYIFLYTTNKVQGMHNKVKNVIWSPLEPIDVHKWYIDPAFH